MPFRGVLTDILHPHLFSRETQWLYASVLLRQVSEAFVVILNPYIFFLVGRDTTLLSWLPLADNERGILAVILWIATMNIMEVLLFPLLARLLQFLGLRNSMVLGQLLLIANWCLVPLVLRWPELFWVLPLLRAPAIVLYWNSRWSLLTAELSLTRVGQSIGTYVFLSRLLVVISPLLGTLLAKYFGHAAPYWVAISLALLSLFALTTLPNLHTRTAWSWSDWVAWLREAGNRRLAAGFSGRHWERLGLDLFWPLFLFLAFDNLLLVGYIATSATLISLLVVYLTGFIFDHRHPQPWYRRLSASGLALIWFGRMLLRHTPLGLVFIDALDRIIDGMYETLYIANIIWLAKRQNALRFYQNREITLALTSLLGCTLAAAFVFTPWFWPGMLMTLILAGGLSLLVRGKA